MKKNWKGIAAAVCFLIVFLILAFIAGKHIQAWMADGRIEVNGVMVSRDRRGIRGSDYLSVKDKLEEYGFPVQEPEDIEEREYMHIPVRGREYVDETTGIQCIYEMTYTYIGEIIEANFDVINLEDADNETFLAAADEYFSMCMELPYEEADIGQAQEWMRENLETVNRGEKTASIVIGGASFQLLGSDQDGKCGARTLKITKAE